MISLLAVLQPPWMRCHIMGLGFCAFARHYLRNHFCFLFLRVLRCFSSPGWPPAQQDDGVASIGLPHSDIRGSLGMCPSPRLFAACRVLRRLREPRHPSCALFSFLFFFKKRAFALFSSFVKDYVFAMSLSLVCIGLSANALVCCEIQISKLASLNLSLRCVYFPVCQCALFQPVRLRGPILRGE